MLPISIARIIALGVLVAVAAPLGAETIRKPMTFSDLVKPPAAAEAKPAVVTVSCAAWEGTLRTSCENNARAFFEHQTWVLKFRQETYEAHASYTLYVFILVCLIVVLGMYLSLRQFNIDTRSRESLLGRLKKKISEKAGAGDARPDAPQGPAQGPVIAPNQLELSATGIKVTSSVLGVIILVVSMGFFYLYLKTVYPIQESSDDSPAAVAKAAVPAATP